LSRFWYDFRFAFRQILRTPTFTLLVILTLALGVGANVAIFSFVRGVLLRPLPYPEPGQLVLACETHPERPAGWCGASPANLADWSRTAKSFDSMALARDWPFSAKFEGKAIPVYGGVATADLFRVLRTQPAAGRLFMPRDMEPGNTHVAVISHAFWTKRLGGKPDVVGKSFSLDAADYQVIGLLPPDFEVPRHEGIDLWIPLWHERQSFRGWRGFFPLGRLADGVTLEQARAEMAAVHANLKGAYPEDNAAWGLSVVPLHEWTVRRVHDALLIFLAAVGLVLLVACANVANLLLARGSTREREVAVRLAMGAGRRGVLQQLFAESVLLALTGSLAGTLLAVWLVDLFCALAPGWFPRLDLVRMDGSVFLFGLALAGVTSILFGLIPALHGSDLNPIESLRGARSAAASRAVGRMRGALVVGEVALAVVLLVGAGLLLRSFAQLLNWQPGFDRNNLVMLQVFNSSANYPKRQMLAQLYQRAVTELRQLPGVNSADAGSAAPQRLVGGDGDSEFLIEGQPDPGTGKKPTTWWFDVGTDYFRTLRIPLLEGRYFTDHDNGTAPFVAIINETMARRHWPNSSPLGQRVHMVPQDATFEIVGVVADVQPFNPEEAPHAEMYWPYMQVPRGAIFFVVRTTGDRSVISAIRSKLAQVDPKMDLGQLITMRQVEERGLVEPRFYMTLLVIFAAVALTIAVVGVYGVMAFFVAQRTQEIGVRMALGALPQDIFRMVLRHGGKLALAGLVAGLVLALALTSLMRSLLIGIAPTDPLTFIGAGVLLLAVGLLACWIPARRATRVDPMVALHYE
jgi:putative ABC transport system permease protein